jgi:recA bacterial DNA recombination protein
MNPDAALTTTLGFRALVRDREHLPSGLAALDAVIQGFPRGSIAEILGGESSGRTTLAHTLLASATARSEICAWVDTSDSFDPVSAAASGVALAQTIWIRCGHNAGHALKVADLLLHAGGFGVVVLDLCRVGNRVLNAIPISYWYRFRRAVENTPTVLAVLEREPLAKSCASLILDAQRRRAVWGGAAGFELLRGVEVEAVSRKPVQGETARFHAPYRT